MNAIRIETTIDSDTLYLPQLKPLLGKSVEIIVTEVTRRAQRPQGGSWTSPLAGSVLEYDEPFEAALPTDEWEASQ